MEDDDPSFLANHQSTELYGHNLRLDWRNKPELKETMDLAFSISDLTTEAAKKYQLTDWEFLYLASVVDIRYFDAVLNRDADTAGRKTIEPSFLPMAVDDCARLMVQRRHSGVKRLFLGRIRDPLEASQELRERTESARNLESFAWSRAELVDED